MDVHIKLFTLYAQLQGNQLISGNLRLSVLNGIMYKQNEKGYYVIQDMRPGFVITNFIKWD